MREPLSVILEWAREGLSTSKKYLIVVCDTYDYEQYPKFGTDDDVAQLYADCNAASMQRVEGLYEILADGQVKAIPHKALPPLQTVDLVLRVSTFHLKALEAKPDGVARIVRLDPLTKIVTFGKTGYEDA
jgi:hypothetical protein